MPRQEALEGRPIAWTVMMGRQIAGKITFPRSMSGSMIGCDDPPAFGRLPRDLVMPGQIFAPRDEHRQLDHGEIRGNSNYLVSPEPRYKATKDG